MKKLLIVLLGCAIGMIQVSVHTVNASQESKGPAEQWKEARQKLTPDGAIALDKGLASATHNLCGPCCGLDGAIKPDSLDHIKQLLQQGADAGFCNGSFISWQAVARGSHIRLSNFILRDCN